MMRVLWLMNEPLPGCAAALGTPSAIGGGWLVALSQALAAEGTIELGVACRVSGEKPASLVLEGIHHFTVPAPKKGYRLLRPSSSMLQRYHEIVDQFSPDVIHVQGTEWYGGLVTVRNRMARPAIVSLQGLMDNVRHHFLGRLGFWDILKSRTLRDWVKLDGLWERQVEWNRRAAVEREIIRGHRAFDGRTLWDRAHLRRLNPDAAYFHCHRAVRSEFFQREWLGPAANRHTVLAASAGYPLKGFHVLVRAIAILKREFPAIQVRVPLANFATPGGAHGLYTAMRRDGYANYLARLIDELGVEENISALGPLTGKQMAEEMQTAHVFVQSSFVENESNTMAEALVVGVPAIVSLAGGIPSLIDEGCNALGFPPGDEAVLAEQIRRVFRDDTLAARLSSAGRALARSRHAPAPVVQRMGAIYSAVARGEHPEYLETP